MLILISSNRTATPTAASARTDKKEIQGHVQVSRRLVERREKERQDEYPDVAGWWVGG